MHLLNCLITTRMENNDVLAHLDKLHLIFERLDSLITVDAPLFVDEILTTSISTSLPQDWLPVVTPLMQRSSVTSATVIWAIKNKVTCRESSIDLSPEAIASRALSAHLLNLGSRLNFNRNSKFCTYCKRRNHDINSCWAKEADNS